MLRSRWLLLCAMAGWMAAAPVQAETYVGARIGLHKILGGGEIEDLFQGDLEAKEFSGGIAGLHAVHYFSANLGAEFSIDAYVPDVDFGLDVTGDPDDVIPVNTSLSMFPISLSARYRLYPDRITPVGVAGLALVPYKFEISSPLDPSLGVDQSGTELGYQLGVGLEVPFGLRWVATSELMYRGASFETSFLDSDGTLLEYKPNFGGVELLVGIAYAF